MEQMDKDVAYKHYEDTCRLTKEAEEKRNKLLLFSVLFLFLFCMLSINPDEMYRWLQEFVKSRSGGVCPLSISISKSLLLIVFMYCQVSYYQKCIYIERQYLYESTLEEEIGITREGASYNNGQPVLLLLIGWFYKFVLPIIFFVFLFFAILQMNDSIAFFLFYCTILIYYVLITVFYMVFQRKTEKQYDNR